MGIGQNSPNSMAGSTGRVVVYLRQAITSGTYQHGDRLPAERQIAEGLSCSRATVRAALRLLERDGVVVRRHGSGTYITHQTQIGDRTVAEATSPLQLIEVRMAIEPHTVRLATINATVVEIERLESITNALEKANGNADYFSTWDQQFHQCLADASKNPLMMSLYAQINEVRGHAQWDAMKGKVLTLQRIQDYNRQHRELLDAITRRDVETSVRIITLHLENARRDLLAGPTAL